MKYIKSFENIDKELKSFLIIKRNNSDVLPPYYTYEIIKIKNIEEHQLNHSYDVVIFKILYEYTDENNFSDKRFERTGNINSIFLKNLKKLILYKGTTLQECIDMLHLLSQTSKYNL